MYYTNPLKGLFKLYAKENALYQIYPALKNQCKIVRLTNEKKLYKANIMRLLLMELRNLSNSLQINIFC